MQKKKCSENTTGRKYTSKISLALQKCTRTNISGEMFQPKQRDSKQFSQVHQHVTLILSTAWVLQFKLQCVVSTAPFKKCIILIALFVAADEGWFARLCSMFISRALETTLHPDRQNNRSDSALSATQSPSHYKTSRSIPLKPWTLHWLRSLLWHVANGLIKCFIVFIMRAMTL